MSVPADFLVALFGTELPAGCRIALWSKPDKQSTYLDSPEQAARFEGKPDVYVSAGLVPADLTTTGRLANAGRRLMARECAGIPGVWLDADVVGGPDNKQGVAPDRDTALLLVRTELEPTIIVNSGYGIQAWWLFDDPRMFGLEQEREQAQRITEGWEELHRKHARRWEQGFGIDSTHDHARLLRFPGTHNAKGGQSAPVEIISDEGPSTRSRRSPSAPSPP